MFRPRPGYTSPADGAVPKYTEYPKVGHNSWSPAFEEKEFWNWIFAQKRKPNK